MPLQLETNLSARFISTEPMTPEEERSLAALNMHAEEVAERLQTTFRLLITEMLDIKRQQFTKEERHHAGSQQADIPSNDRTDSGSPV